MQWIICVSWDGSACPTLFPGCFQSHQLHFRKDPGAHYFAGTGCFCLPMSGFRDWSHLKLGLDLGLCMCNLWMYPHNVYTFMLLMYITRRVYVICMYLFQDKIKKKKKRQHWAVVAILFLAKNLKFWYSWLIPAMANLANKK